MANTDIEKVEPKKTSSKRTTKSTSKNTTQNNSNKKTTTTKRVASKSQTNRANATKKTTSKTTKNKKENVKVAVDVEKNKEVVEEINVIKNEEIVLEEPTTEIKAEEAEAVVVTDKDEKNQTEEEKDKFDVEKQEKQQTVLKIIGKVIVYVFLVILAFIVVFPFYFMIISSLKTEAEYNSSVPTLWITMSAPQFHNYIDCLNTNGYNLGRYMLNTILVGVVSTILSLVITILSAYAFARLKFKGRDLLFAILLGTMMIPGELFTITNYATVYNFGWINTYTVLIVPFLVSVFYIYLLRQNFKQIPDQLYYAAKVDGTSDFKYLWKVMIPLAAPSIVSITILKLMGSWNSYLWPQLVCTDKNMLLITNGLRTAYTDNSSGMTNFPLQMAACVVVSIPLFIVFILFRKYIMRGVSKSGIKG